jgi:hypothetical protein
MREPPLYRPFAIVAFLATLAVGTPVGIWMSSWLYLGAAAVPVQWVLLHAHIQILGFFGVLIPGVAHHLLARFTGRPVTRGPVTRWILGLLAAGVVFRLLGTGGSAPALVAAAATLEAAGFVAFGAWLWRSLDPPPLALLRWHLGLATAWLAIACLTEAVFRWEAVPSGLPVPAMAVVRATHAMALLGGAIGWVLGVLLRAGPMFATGWRVPPAAARAAPFALAAGVLLAAIGEAGPWAPAAGAALARLGELLAVGTFAALVALSGGFRRDRRTLPMVARSPEEARIFRLALASAGAAAIGAAVAAAVAWSGRPDHLLTDVVRHLVTIGLLTSVVVAMAFRLIPVLEGRALPWPRLRDVAFWCLLFAVVLRSGEWVVGRGWSGPAPWVPLSGLLVWAALACVAVSLGGVVARTPRQRDAGGGR